MVNDRSGKGFQKRSEIRKQTLTTDCVLPAGKRVNGDVRISICFNDYVFSAIRGTIRLEISSTLNYCCFVEDVFPIQKGKGTLLRRGNQTLQQISSSAVPASITITPTNITSPMAPKVAIVIYSMYGHIVKCSCPISYVLYFHLIHFLPQWPRPRRRASSPLVVRPPSTSMRGLFPAVMTSLITL